MEGEDPDPRFTLANERTYLAWNRTALALVGGGLAAAQLLGLHSHAGRPVVSPPPVGLGGAPAAGVRLGGGALVRLAAADRHGRRARRDELPPLGGQRAGDAARPPA